MTTTYRNQHDFWSHVDASDATGANRLQRRREWERFASTGKKSNREDIRPLPKVYFLRERDQALSRTIEQRALTLANRGHAVNETVPIPNRNRPGRYDVWRVIREERDSGRGRLLRRNREMVH